MLSVKKQLLRVIDGVPLAVAHLANRAVLISIVVVLAWGLLGARYAIITYSPSIAHHAGVYAGIINAVVDVLDVFVLWLRGTVDLIKDAIRFFRGKGGRVHVTKPRFDPVTADGLRRAFTDLPARCVAYEGVAPVLSGAAKATLSNYTCPVIRATWPVPWLYTITDGVLGWTSENAVPPNAYYSGQRPGNCEETYTADWLCIGLGAGYVALEVLLPLLLILILWDTVILPVVKLIMSVATDSVIASYDLAHVIYGGIDRGMRRAFDIPPAYRRTVPGLTSGKKT